MINSRLNAIAWYSSDSVNPSVGHQETGDIGNPLHINREGRAAGPKKDLRTADASYCTHG